MKKKKNCKKATSYNCGNSCINERYVCRKEGLSGQSVDIANRLAAMVGYVVAQPLANAPVESSVNQSPAINSTQAKLDKLSAIGIADPRPTLWNLEDYVGASKQAIEQNDKNNRTDPRVDRINEFIAKSKPYNGELYGSLDTFNIDIGETFNMPSITTLSTEIPKESKELFKIINNTSAVSTEGITDKPVVITTKDPEYKLVDIERYEGKPLFILEEV